MNTQKMNEISLLVMAWKKYYSRNIDVLTYECYVNNMDLLKKLLEDAINE